jgi:hypothetical protein
MSADEKATDDRPAALLPMNERRDMLFFFDMRDLLLTPTISIRTLNSFSSPRRKHIVGRSALSISRETAKTDARIACRDEKPRRTGKKTIDFRSS